MDAVVWIIVAVVVLAVVIGLVAWSRRRGAARTEERNRQHAQEIRREAEADSVKVQRREAEAAKIDAAARQAQAEADARAAEAARLKLEADQRSEQVGGERSEVEQRLHKADQIDPDVDPSQPERQDGSVSGSSAPTRDGEAVHHHDEGDVPPTERPRGSA